MKIGDIIEARIVEAHEGYALLSYNEFSATLMQIELTWNVEPRTVKEFLAEKESVMVRVTAINENILSVSIKRTGENPWDKPPVVGTNQIPPMSG